jgi:hypothetical protein
MPQRVVDALERWRRAERRLATAPVGSAEWYEARSEVKLAREEYYRIAELVADEMVEQERAGEAPGNQPGP